MGGTKQVWEYTTVSCTKERLVDELNKMGKDDWEAFSILVVAPNVLFVVLKRDWQPKR